MTEADQASSTIARRFQRRKLLRDGAAAFVAGATAAVLTIGALPDADADTIAPAAPLAAGVDDELIGWCAAVIAMEAEWRRAGELDEDPPRPDGYYDTVDAIERTPARTVEGNRAKLAAAVSFFYPDPSIEWAPMNAVLWDAACALALPPSVPARAASDQVVPFANPELIELCDQLLALNAQTRALIATRHSIEDEQRTEPELLAISDREQELTERVCQMEIRTFAEAKAVAAAIFANAALDDDGRIETNAWGEWLPAHLTECLVGKSCVRAAS